MGVSVLSFDFLIVSAPPCIARVSRLHGNKCLDPGFPQPAISGRPPLSVRRLSGKLAGA